MMLHVAETTSAVARFSRYGTSVQRLFRLRCANIPNARYRKVLQWRDSQYGEDGAEYGGTIRHI